MRFILAILLLVVSFGASPVHAQNAAVAQKVEEALKQNDTKLTDEQMNTVIQTLENQAERDAFLNKLKALKNATALTADPAKKEPVVPSVQALDAITNSMSVASSNFTMIVKGFADLPQASKWLQKQFDSEEARAAWINFFAQAAAAIAAGLIAKYIVKLFLRRPRRMLAELKFDNLPAKLGAFFGYHLLSLLPVVAFTTAALFTLGVFELEPKANKAMIAFLDAFIVQHVITWALQMVFAERAPRLRFLPLADESAAYLFVWCTRLSAFIVFGFFLSQAALYLDVPKGSVHAFSSFIGLIITLMVVIIVLQNRAQVSNWLRGKKDKDSDATFVQATRARVADVWHVLAIVYLVIGYVIAALDIEQGFTTLIKATLVTLVTFILFRFILSSIDHLVEKDFALPDELKRQFPFLEQRTNSYLPILERVVKAFAWIIGTLIILSAWGFDTAAWFATPVGKKVVSAAISITITLFVVVVAWEFVSNGVDRYLQGEDAHGRRIERSARMRTLLPLIRYASHTTLIIVATFIILSEFGLDITPLLAGAGIIGLAVGFGAQTLVKDFITGLFILLEDTISVGDVVKVGNHSGVVETFTIRTLKLRDAQGHVHSIPFSEVTSIVNQTKNFAYVLVEVGVGYDADLQNVMKVMKQVADEMRKDPAFTRYIYEAMEIFGIERFDASSIAMRARMKTDGQKQWAIKREYLLRLKHAFDKEGIDIPYPITVQRTLLPNDLAAQAQQIQDSKTATVVSTEAKPVVNPQG